MNPSISRLTLLLALVRRDYAVQYAGMALGMLWLVVQYMLQIGIFWIVLGKGVYSDQADYGAHLLSGMVLWLPLSEMWMRAGSILSENRILIRRTTEGRDLFVWIPVVQAFLHYPLLALPVSVILAISTGHGLATTLTVMLSGLLSGWIFLLLLSPWVLLIARLAVILRDLTPLLRPAMQILFWLTPVAYMQTSWSSWNPLTIFFSLHGAWFASLSVLDAELAWISGLVFLILMAVATAISFLRLGRVVEDLL